MPRGCSKGAGSDGWLGTGSLGAVVVDGLLLAGAREREGC